MAYITRIYRASDDFLVAEGTPEQVAKDKFIDYLTAGTTTTEGEYYAINHDDSGNETDSPKVDLSAFTKPAQAPAPTATVSAESAQPVASATPQTPQSNA